MWRASLSVVTKPCCPPLEAAETEPRPHSGVPCLERPQFHRSIGQVLIVPYVNPPEAVTSASAQGPQEESTVAEKKRSS